MLREGNRSLRLSDQNEAACRRFWRILPKLGEGCCCKAGLANERTHAWTQSVGSNASGIFWKQTGRSQRRIESVPTLVAPKLVLAG